MFSTKVCKLLSLLPSYPQIESLLVGETEAAYILGKAIKNMAEIDSNCIETIDTATEEISYLMQCLADKFWERIHTGHFSKIPIQTRKIYALANLFKIFYLLFESVDKRQIELCSACLDDAMLVGTTQELYAGSDKLLETLMSLLDELTVQHDSDKPLQIIELTKRLPYDCDITILDCPTLMDFKVKCFDSSQPALLINTIGHWPALEKWHDLNYINKIAGNRCVPIEIGSNYATDEWSQQIVKIRDFLQRQFTLEKSNTTEEIEYLAQHELFDQIPTLKVDISIPDYCTLGNQATDVDIKAWLGPKGTISPMHFDPKHNFLCQVFGTKFIILAAPDDTHHLYPHESEFLGNTSRIDAANIDLAEFPLTANVKFYKLHLQRGDCLYLPPKWWHYVRSESPSFSVSFWWQ